METTTSRDTVSCDDILARLHENDLEDLEAWRHLEDLDSAHLGGRGRTDAQMDAADRAWDALSPTAQTAFIDMRRSVVDDLIAAIRDVGIPDTDRDIDAITALLGHDHSAFRILPAYALVDAYMEALERKDVTTITIAPTADMVNLLADDEDILTNFDTWLGRSVPASAVPRLARFQEIATARILRDLPTASVVWSSENVHVMGAVQKVQVVFNDDYDDEGFTKSLVEAIVEDNLDQALHEVVKAIVDGTLED